MKSVSKTQSRLVTLLTVIVTLLPFAQYFASGITAVAESTGSAEQTLFKGDNGSGKIAYQKDPDNKQLDWTITYQKAASDLARQIGFTLKSDDKIVTPEEVKSQPADLFSLSHAVANVEDNTILQSKATKDTESNVITFKTPIVTNLSVQTLLNELKEDGSQADLFASQTPVTINLPKEVTESSSSTEASSSTIQSESTKASESTSTSTVSSQSSVAQSKAPVSSEAVKASSSAASTAKSSSSVEATVSTESKTSENSKASASSSNTSAKNEKTTTTSTTKAKAKVAAKKAVMKAKAEDVELLQDDATGRDITTLDGADQLNDSKEGKTIFDSADIYVNGSTTPMKDGDSLNLNDSLLLKYAWSLPESLRQNMKDGDTYSFKLPDGFKVQGTEPLTGALKNDQGTTFGNFVVQLDGSVVITFTDAVTTNSGIHGTFNVSGSVDQKVIDKPGDNPITLPFTDSDKTIVPDVVVPNSSALDKVVASQTADVNVKDNQGSVTWKLTANKTGKTMTDGVLTDTLPTGATFNKDSVKVLAYDVDLATGNLTGAGTDVTSSVTTSQSGNDVSFKLPDSKQAYVVTFDTAVDLNKSLATDGRSASVENNATLSSKDNKDVTAKATATFGSSSKIAKQAGTYDDQKSIAAWNVVFTKSGLDIPAKDYFIDQMDNGQYFADPATGKELSLTDLEKQLNDQFQKNGNQGKTVQLTKTDKGTYDIAFPQGISDSFTFTYYTKVLGQTGITYNNNIKWNDQGNNANQGFVKDSGVTKGFVAGSDGLPVDKANGNVTWQVGMNKENAPIDKWSVTDTMGSTTVKSDSDIKVYEVKKGAADTDRTLVKNGYQVNLASDGKSFTVTYDTKNTTDSKFIIEYTSSYPTDLGTNVKVTNNAQYTYWENGNSWVKNGNSSFIPNPDTRKQLSASKGGSYNFTTNQVTWLISANTGKIPFGDHAIVTDPIPSGQTYNPSSANPTVFKEDGTTKADGFTFTYVAKGEKQTINGQAIDGGANGVLAVTGFPKDDSNLYKVQFTTDMTDNKKLPEGSADNYATLADDSNKPVTVKGTVSYTQSDKFITKDSKKNGDSIHYVVTVNPSSYDLKNVVVTDNNWKNIKVNTDSIVIKDATGKDVTDQFKDKISKEEQQFKIDFGDINSSYTVEYDGDIQYVGNPGDKINISNDVQIIGDNIKDGGHQSENVTQVNVPAAGGDAEGETRNLTVTKNDEKGNPLKGAQFTLYRGKPADGKVVRSDVATDDNGQITFNKLTYDTYYLVETKPADGYYISSEQLKDGIAYVINGDTDKDKGYLDPDTKATPVLVNKPAGQIQLTKVDSADKDTTLAGAVFELDQNGQKVTQDASGNKLDTFTTDKDGNLTIKNLIPGTYQLKEITAPDGYQVNKTTTEADVASGDTDKVTVSDDVNTTSISGTKTWNDNNDQDGKRPDAITIQLMKKVGSADATVAQSKTVTAKDSWKYEFTNLPVKEKNQAVTYSIAEKAVPDYTSVVTGNDVANTHTPEVTKIDGTKTWKDNNNQDGKRPTEITVHVMDGSKEVATQKVTADTNWKYSFDNLPVYENGKKINYTISEDAVTGYTTTTNGDDLTNSYSPESVEVTGTKTWNDSNDQDGKRPSKITIDLYANNEKVDSTTADATTGWKYSFKNLAKNKDGQPIVYTVKEEAVEGYTTEIKDFNITNNYTPETTKVTVKKVWEDKNNQDGKRPGTVTVQLYADGEKSGDPITLSDNNQWTHTWDNLAKNAKGKAITYTVKENAVSEYKSDITADKDGNFTITNTHTPATTEVAGLKTWDDSNNQDGKRPTEVTINLLKAGTKIDSKTVTAKDNWKYSFADLPKYENGQEIQYSITEDTVANYQSTINGNNVTNSYTPANVNIAGTKIWKDNENQDGTRPANITVNLLADGTKIKDEVVSPDDNGSWTYNFNNLPKNKDGKAIKYEVTENEVPGYTTTMDGDNIVNTHTPATTEVSAKKVWEDNSNQDGTRPKSVTVQLMADGVALGKPVTLDASNEWSYNWTKLAKYENKDQNRNAAKEVSYTVEETSKDAGYTVEVTPAAVANKDHAADYVVTNKHTAETTNVKGVKTWHDADNQDGLRPESIDVQLMADGVAVDGQTQTVKADTTGAWSYEFTNLPVYKDGNKIVYTVKEVKVPTGYTEKDNETGITNTHKPETTKVEGVKTWSDNDNQDGVRPDSITVHLLANGKETASQKVTASNDWKYSFSDLPKFENGQAIDYTIKEDKVADYETTINDKDLTNTHKPAETTYSVKKAWNDSENQDGIRPEKVEIQLYADGSKSGQPVVLSDENGWSYTWEHLAKMSNENGKLSKSHVVDYSVKEVDVSKGYADATKTIADENSAVITNSHTPAITSVTGVKTWADADNQDGKRPDSITVHLMNGDKEVASKVVTAKDDWKYSFSDLPKFEQQGKEINYTVKEDAVSDYETTIEGSNITNTHKPELIKVSGTKTWEDNNNQDGIRPDTINVQLYANDKAVRKVKAVKAKADGNWTYTFTDLPKYEKGKEITYTVKEADAVTGYTETDKGMDLTNTHTPAVVSLDGTKTWSDNDNQDGKRPDSITVHLMNGDQEVASKVVTAKDNWKYSFTDLPKFEQGQAINYTIKEDTVSDYQTDVKGMDLTNTHTPEMTEVSGTKTWSDQEDRYKTRPTQITVNLMAGTKIVKSQQVTAATNWAYNFKDLPKYENGKVIDYSVSEDKVAGYKATNNGFDLTNMLETTNFSGTKLWEDQNNKDNLRPTQITVALMQNGVKFAETTVSATTKWEYAFNDLPKVDQNGNAYRYSAKEENVPTGYTSMVVGKNIVNVHVPNIPHIPHTPTPKTPTPKLPHTPGVPDITTPTTDKGITIPTTAGIAATRGSLPDTGGSDVTSNRRLPQTNDQRNNYLVVIGAIIVAAAAYFIWRKNRHHA